MAGLHLSAYPSMKVVARIYRDATAVGADIPMTEIEGIGEYYANVPSGLAEGKYLVVFLSDGSKIASGILAWDGTEEIDLAHIEKTQSQSNSSNAVGWEKLDRILKVVIPTQTRTDALVAIVKANRCS